MLSAGKSYAQPTEATRVLEAGENNCVQPQSVDFLHPRYFVQVYECDSDIRGCEDGRPVIAQAARGAIEYVNAEVDASSKILISFNRKCLSAFQQENDLFEAAISITGFVGDREIEIPGYSVVGKEARVAQARVRSISDLRSVFIGLKNAYEMIEEELDDAFEISAQDLLPAYESRDDAAADDSDLRRLTERRAALEADYQAMKRRKIDLMAQQATLDLTYAPHSELRSAEHATSEADIGTNGENSLESDSAKVDGVSSNADSTGLKVEIIDESAQRMMAEKRQQNNRYAAELRVIEVRMEAVQEDLDKVEGQVNALRGDLDDEEKNRQTVYAEALKKLEILRYVQRALRREHAALHSLLDKISNDQNDDLIRMMGVNLTRPRSGDRLIEGSKGLVRELEVAEQDTLLHSEAGAETFLAALRALNEGLSELASVAADLQADRPILRRRLVADLRDTEILLSRIDVEAGDDLFVIIENAARTDDIARRLIVKLEVRQFGLVRDVSDSFLFLEQRAPELEDITADLAGSGIDPSTPTGQEVVRRLQESVDEDFKPVAGASLSWIWRTRPTHSSNVLRRAGVSLARFFEPGFGVNVSFPAFERVEVARVAAPVSQESTTQTEEQEAVQNQPVISTSSNPLDVSAGLMASLFGGQITFTYGWNLTSRSDARDAYMGFGFSFVNIAQRLSK